VPEYQCIDKVTDVFMLSVLITRVEFILPHSEYLLLSILSFEVNWRTVLILQRPVIPLCMVSMNIKQLHVSIHNAFTCFVETVLIFSYTALTGWFYNQNGVCLLRGTD
jgi:hypothetical protein